MGERYGQFMPPSGRVGTALRAGTSAFRALSFDTLRGNRRVRIRALSVTSQISPSCEERAQVERLLADPLFSQSKRYGAFLRYVTERALSNAQEPLTERHLGVGIFGRPPNYDTDADPIVRVTASELRKRLAHYYEDPAHAGEIRVLIHKGSYVAEFVAPGTPPPPVEVVAPQVVSAAPAQATEPTTETRWRLNGHRWYYVAGLAGFCIVVAVFVWIVRPRPSAFDLFWAPVLDGPHDVVLSFPQFSDHVHLEGVDNPKLTWSDPLTLSPDPMAVTWTQYARRLVHVSDLSVACRISEFLGSKGKHTVVKGEHDLTMHDLREAPAVILGGLANQWTTRFLPQARFTFAGEGSVRFIRDLQKPESRQWSFDAKVPSNNREKDLIIISRVSDSVSGRVTVLAGGFSVWGTDAAVELLTDPNQMKRVLAGVPLKWDSRNVQIALECSVVNRESGIPRFLAAHYW